MYDARWQPTVLGFDRVRLATGLRAGDSLQSTNRMQLTLWLGERVMPLPSLEHELQPGLPLQDLVTQPPAAGPYEYGTAVYG